MSNEIRIYLDNYNNFCSPGQTISGRVECNFIGEKIIRAILVRFEGKCCISWTESESYYDDFFKENRTREVDYSAEEVYFNQEFNLTGEGRCQFTLPPGKHVYTFSYQLPTHLPSSYDDSLGRGTVRYVIRAKVDSPWRFDTEALAVLNVISLLDLNYIPRIREPAQVSVDKVLCSCWCNSADSLTFTFTLPTTGFVPGQHVPVGAYVQNMTNVSVERVQFKIIQTTEFIANSPSTAVKRSEDVVSDYIDYGVGAHGDKSWTALLSLSLDKTFPNLNPCSLINITYTLKGKACLPCPHSNLKASIPITIGNVSLTGGELNVALGPPQEPFSSAAPVSTSSLIGRAYGDRGNYGTVYTVPTAPPNDQEHGVPPSYEEATNAK